MVPEELALVRAGFTFANCSFLGGAFLAAGVSTAALALPFLDGGTGGGEGTAVGTGVKEEARPRSFFLVNSSGWMFGKTPPDAIVTPFSN